MLGFLTKATKIRYVENMYLGSANQTGYHIFVYTDLRSVPDNSVTFIWDDNSIFKGFSMNISSGLYIGNTTFLRIFTSETRQSFAENVYDRTSNGLDTITVNGLGSQYLNKEQIALITSKGYTLVN